MKSVPGAQDRDFKRRMVSRHARAPVKNVDSWLDTNLVSWLLNFLVMTFPNSNPSRSAIFRANSLCEFPPKTFIFGILGEKSLFSFTPEFCFCGVVSIYIMRMRVSVSGVFFFHSSKPHNLAN